MSVANYRKVYLKKTYNFYLYQPNTKENLIKIRFWFQIGQLKPLLIENEKKNK